MELEKLILMKIVKIGFKVLRSYSWTAAKADYNIYEIKCEISVRWCKNTTTIYNQCDRLNIGQALFIIRRFDNEPIWWYKTVVFRLLQAS